MDEFYSEDDDRPKGAPAHFERYRNLNKEEIRKKLLLKESLLTD